mmetsp:Transcript_575/g.734  ORF Transcript_575/g.734 Transcript_575/m.734 type:complete len:114 (+) Transcript_575:28-369(+)
MQRSLDFEKRCVELLIVRLRLSARLMPNDHKTALPRVSHHVLQLIDLVTVDVLFAHDHDDYVDAETSLVLIKILNAAQGAEEVDHPSVYAVEIAPTIVYFWHCDVVQLVYRLL